VTEGGKPDSALGNSYAAGLKEAKDYATLAVMKFHQERANTIAHADLKVQLMARACQPDVKINKQNFQFGECAMNERRDMQLTIRNKNSDLPLDFNFSKIANFRAIPGKGKLMPGNEHTINFSFEPKNFGVFS
jgi:hypothetical protein